LIQLCSAFTRLLRVREKEPVPETHV
jgi:hypothetical protein